MPEPVETTDSGGLLDRMLGAACWSIATEQEEYLRDYIPRTCLYSASREIKIEDLYDNLDPRRGVGIEVGRRELYVSLTLTWPDPEVGRGSPGGGLPSLECVRVFDPSMLIWVIRFPFQDLQFDREASQSGVRRWRSEED